MVFLTFNSVRHYVYNQVISNKMKTLLALLLLIPSLSWGKIFLNCEIYLTIDNNQQISTEHKDGYLFEVFELDLGNKLLIDDNQYGYPMTEETDREYIFSNQFTWIKLERFNLFMQMALSSGYETYYRCKKMDQQL